MKIIIQTDRDYPDNDPEIIPEIKCLSCNKNMCRWKMIQSDGFTDHGYSGYKCLVCDLDIYHTIVEKTFIINKNEYYIHWNILSPSTGPMDEIYYFTAADMPIQINTFIPFSITVDQFKKILLLS